MATIQGIETSENPEPPTEEEFKDWQRGKVGAWYFGWLTDYFHQIAEHTIREGNINYESVEETALYCVRNATKSNTIFEIANADVDYIKSWSEPVEVLNEEEYDEEEG
jgi:hypothetical protein